MILLAAQLYLFQPGQMTELGFQNRLGLGVGELKAGDQRQLGFLLGAQDADHLVQIKIGDQQPVQNMQALFDLVAAVLQPPPHGDEAILEPLVQNAPKILDSWPTVQADHIEIDPVAFLQIRGGKQMIQQQVHIHPIRA